MDSCELERLVAEPSDLLYLTYRGANSLSGPRKGVSAEKCDGGTLLCDSARRSK